MNVGALNSIPGLSSLTNEPAPKEELGKDQFLRLMVAQMENQDPLSPAENGDFLAQLAQFSSVEGIDNLNTSMDSMAAALTSGLTVQAASLVGRSVLVPTNQALSNGNGLIGDVNVETSSSQVFVEISDATGALVKRLPLGAQDSGVVRFTWNGLGESGSPQPAGLYRVRAYSGGADESTELTVDLPEKVLSVSLDSGSINLNLSGGSTVAASAVKEIQ